MKFDIAWIVIMVMLVALFAFLFFYFFSKTTHRDGKTARYDERQSIARGRGYMYAFYASVLVSLLPCFFTDEMKHLFGNIMYCIPLFVGLAVHTGYCIWNNAYIELNLDSKRWMTSIFFISLMNLLLAFNDCHRGFLDKGTLKIGLLNLAFGVLGIIIMIEIRIKSSIDKKREAVEDEELEA